MIRIAEEKLKYYTALKEEIRNKYKSKREQEQLIKDKKGDEWTHHMSRKRQQVKRSVRVQNQIDKTRKPENMTQYATVEEKLQIEQEVRNKRKHTKAVQQQLISEGGKKKKARRDNKSTRNVHLDVYSNALKTLVARLNDDTLDAV